MDVRRDARVAAVVLPAVLIFSQLLSGSRCREAQWSHVTGVTGHEDIPVPVTASVTGMVCALLSGLPGVIVMEPL